MTSLTARRFTLAGLISPFIIQRNGANSCAIILNHRDRIVMADQLRASFAQRPSKPDSFYLRLRFAWKFMHSEIRDKAGIDELE